MKTKNSPLNERLLLAPARLVAAFPMLSGYDMGIAATAGSLEFDLPDFVLGDRQLSAVECALRAVEQAHSAYYWRAPLTEDELMALEIGELPMKTAGELLREKQERLKKISKAVVEGDMCLPRLRQYGLVLTATTQRSAFAPVPESMAPRYPFSAIVALQSVK
jgi:hypothetical protein